MDFYNYFLVFYVTYMEKRHILLNSVWKIYSLTQFWNELNLLLHARSGNISTCFQYMKTQQMANDGQ